MSDFNLVARETNTGGGCMVTIITNDEWDYILVTNDECVTAYRTEDEFWDGKDCLFYAPIQLGE